MRAAVKCLNNQGFKYSYFTPTYALANEQYERACVFFDPCIAHSTTKPFPKITFHTGSRIQFRGVERPKYLRGTGEDEVFIDESQDIPERTYENVLRPFVSDKRGTIIMAGQFRGKDWRYEKYFVPGQEPAARDYKSWRCPTSDGIAFQSDAGKAELALVKQQLTQAVYDQEYECLPVANQAAVFYPEDLEVISTDDKPYDKALPGWVYVAGVDLGWRVDHTAVCIVGFNPSTGEIKVVKCWQQPLRTKHEANAPFIAKELQRFNARAVVDVTGGATGGKTDPDEYIKHYRMFMSDLQPFTFTSESKMRLVKYLGLKIEKYGVTIPKAFKDTLLKELYAYEFTYDHKTKGYKYNAPLGMHDDLVTALMLAVWGVHCGWYRESLEGARQFSGTF